MTGRSVLLLVDVDAFMPHSLTGRRHRVMMVLIRGGDDPTGGGMR